MTLFFRMSELPVSLETKIVDFLGLMQKCYQKEMEEELSASKNEEIDEESDDRKHCGGCGSSICDMIQKSNEGLKCWKVYVEEPHMVYRYWFTGKVLPLIKK